MSASNGRKYVLRIQQKLTHIIIHTSLRHGYSFRQQKLRLTLQIRTTTRVSLFLRVCVCVRVCARLQSGPERIAQSLMHHHFTTICSRITRFSPKMLLMYVDVDYPHPHPQKTRRFCNASISGMVSGKSGVDRGDAPALCHSAWQLIRELLKNRE